MRRIGFSSNDTGLKLVAGFVVSGTVMFVWAGDVKSGTSWLITLSAALAIMAVHFWLLRPGKRSSKNAKPFLLQTYKRYMGDALHDLSVPIYVNRRHWGCLRVGFKAATEENQGTK